VPKMTETTTDRAANVQRVLQLTQNENDDVKQTALQAIVPPPTRSTADIVWLILVSGLVAVLVLAIPALMHVLGHSIAADKLITVFTTTLAGLLGLFIKALGSQ
jgi:hypothetical protein